MEMVVNLICIVFFLNDTERTLLDTVLETCNGNVTKSADFLGISRGTLIKRIKEYNLKIK